MSVMERFQRLCPSRFTGRRGPESAETWHFDIEGLLESLSFMFEEMVSLATFTLRDLARTWWRGVSRTRRDRFAREGCRHLGMRWDEFTALLLDRWVGFAARDNRQA